jgi:hypothetical protein
MVEQRAVVAQPPREKKDLRMKAPPTHVLVKVGQVGIFLHSLVERLPLELLRQQPRER